MNKYMVILHGDSDEGTEVYDQFSVIGPLPENYSPITPINNFWEAGVFEEAEHIVRLHNEWLERRQHARP